jgi:hypothetical protein
MQLALEVEVGRRDEGGSAARGGAALAGPIDVAAVAARSPAMIGRRPERHRRTASASASTRWEAGLDESTPSASICREHALRSESRPALIAQRRVENNRRSVDLLVVRHK